MNDEVTENNVIEMPEIDVKEAFESVKLKVEPEQVNEVLTEIVDKSNRKARDDLITEDKEKTKELLAEFGSFLETAADIVEATGTKETVSTGIDILDAILGGGFAIGALNIIIGQPGSGKTMLAIQSLGNAQRQFKEIKERAGLIGCFLDSEEATTPIRLKNLGVNLAATKMYDDVTVEKVFQLLEGLSVFKREKKILDIPSMVIWDSIANTLSQKEREADDPNTVIGYKARLLSLLIPKYLAKLAQNNICLVAVNQLRDNIQMGQYSPAPDLKFMSASKVMPGGNVLKYNAFQLLDMKIKTAIKDKEAEKYGFEGIIVTLKCVKNKLFQPNVLIELVGSFVTGFSNFWTNYNFLKETKRLNSASWCHLVSYPDKRFRTKDALTLYNENEEFRTHFDKNVKEAIQIDIVEKYNTIL